MPSICSVPFTVGNLAGEGLLASLLQAISTSRSKLHISQEAEMPGSFSLPTELLFLRIMTHRVSVAPCRKCVCVYVWTFGAVCEYADLGEEGKVPP